MPRPVVFLGADHAGFKLKEQIKPLLEKRAMTVVDLSPRSEDGDDYPKIATRVARHVARTSGAKGVLLCGSGIGVTIAANRVKGVRAFDAFDETTVRLARAHTDVNVIAFSGWRQTSTDARKLLDIFFSTSRSTAARHLRRIAQLG